MALHNLVPLLNEHEGFTKLLQSLDASHELPVIADAAKPFLISGLASKHNRILVVLRDENEAQQFADTLKLFVEDDVKILTFLDRDALPYERLMPDRFVTQHRLETLSTLVQDRKKPVIACASIRSLMQSVIPPSELRSFVLQISKGQTIDLDTLLEMVYRTGYEQVAEIETPGQVSHRGGIVDIFTPLMKNPIRIEFFGDEIDTLRTIDPQTQRSLNHLESMVLVPAREAISLNGPKAANVLGSLDISSLHSDARQRWERDLEQLTVGASFEDIVFYLPYLHEPASLLDYFDSNSLVVLDSENKLSEISSSLLEQGEDLRLRLERQGENPEGIQSGYLSWSDLKKKLDILPVISLADPFEAESVEKSSVSLPDFTATQSYGGRLKDLIKDIQQNMNRGQRTLIVTEQSRRLAETLNEETRSGATSLEITPSRALTKTPTIGSISLIHGYLPEGWQSRVLGLQVLSDTEIFGWTKRRTRVKAQPKTPAAFLEELHVGDYIVHQEHGIGRFEGLKKLNMNGSDREYLLIHYSGTDKLYIPTDQLDRITRYIGMGDSVPALSKLGSTEWTRAKQKVKENVQEIARDLLRLYSVREAAEGFAFTPDEEQPWLQELEAAFPFEETPDQAKAIEDVKADMEAKRSMDRLICGDVGYGKTEVALRAAFKAVLDHKQVAILAPTTILALQHFNTFSERLQAYPVRVALLSRFRSEKEQKRTIEDLALGKVDIVIGTHRLLQKDVVFSDLGLVVIDEEQRFGVVHKERLKQLRTEVDVLTLSATPIPRTLHMSLVNVRDMSVIETPPQERLPIRTYIHEYNDTSIREAILREIDRGGQVFFVHNRVQGIQVIAQSLQKLIPEASIAVAHGQMNEDQLEKVMLDFSSGKYDVLLCTTIIENGLDIPNANTIIVNNSSHFGLAQLYQLRGRVGRSDHQAYAYFLYNKDTKLTPIAEKRLRAIFEATELGAGFRIAMKDLEIRGAGNLLGPEQSGFMNSVGFDLYCKLLAEAVEEMKGKKVEATLPQVTLDLPISAYIPDEYIGDRSLKMSFYQRLVNIASSEDLAKIQEEMTDRFGTLDEPVLNLVSLINLKLLAAELGYEGISARDSELILTTKRTMVANRIALYRKFRNDARVQGSIIHIPLRLLGNDLISALPDTLRLVSSKSNPSQPSTLSVS